MPSDSLNSVFDRAIITAIVENTGARPLASLGSSRRPHSILSKPMARFLYAIEDRLEDAVAAQRLPRWMRQITRAASRTIGEMGDMISRHRGHA